jgi:DNA-directed RNA polymerase subunit M/transcription elongation factor TFIIS
MEVRCRSCNKLFRIADEKISGSGIKFACSQCGGPVKVTREEFEQYVQTKTAEPVLPSVAPQPRKMDVRCGSCNKSFRVSEDKITGSGIKFACSKCGNPVRITREEFEQYFEPKEPEPSPPPVVQQPLKMEVRCSSCSKPFRIAEDKITGSGIKFACSKCGALVTISKEDLDNYKRSLEKAGARDGSSTELRAPLSAASVPVPAAAVLPKKPAERAGHQLLPVVSTSNGAAMSAQAPPIKPAAAPMESLRAQPPVLETKSSSSLQPEQPKPTVKQRSEPTGTVRPATIVSASSSVAPSSTLRQLMVLGVAVLIIVAVGYGAISRFKASAPAVKEPVRMLTSTDGLEIVNNSAVLDAKGDYVISGDIVNTTDVERPAWLVVAEVFDANGASLGRARMLNGIELYTHRDYEVLAKRGTNVQELKARKFQEQRSKLLPRGTVHFEIAIIEAPAGIVKSSASLQPFDPVQLFKEVIAEQKQP